MRTSALIAALFVPAAILVPVVMAGGTPEDAPYSGLPPDGEHGELATFRIAPGFRIELVAAEPDVTDPVSVAFDARGRLWVAEMSDYPLGPGSGRVRWLEDLDKDGRIDANGIFAEGLPFPASVLPHRAGVLVAAAPDILYLEDTDRDERADLRRAVLTGFAEGNTQLRVNGLIRGIDGLIYGANGRAGGRPRRPGDPEGAAVDIGERDFRFDPETYALEAIGGPSQFGHAFDAWGRRFLSWNTVHIRQEVLRPADLERHPGLLRTACVAPISDHGDSARIHPLIPPPRTFNNEPTDHFNASCGLTVETGGIFPEEYAGSAFVCEPLAGIIHRDRLDPGAGPAFIARRGEDEKEREFLASTDPWFHPVNLRSGPDGALYVADLYREMVEHPHYVPEAIRGKVDFVRGRGRGRIWRILPVGVALLPVEDLSGLDARALFARLSSPNGPVRETAQSILLERRDVGSLGRLELLPHPRAGPARAHALWTLHRLGGLSSLMAYLSAPEAGLRETALRIARENRDLLRFHAMEVCLMTDDGDPRVRLQAALAVGDLVDEVPEDEAAGALLRAASRDMADPWCRAAIASSLRGREASFLARFALLDPRPGEDARTMEELAREVAFIAGASKDIPSAKRVLEEAGVLLGEKRPLRRVFTIAEGLAAGLARAGAPARGTLSSTPGGEDARRWSALFERAARGLELEELEGKRQGEGEGAGTGAGAGDAGSAAAAALLLGHAPASIALGPLGRALDPRASLDLQLAAARALGTQDGPEAAAVILSSRRGATPRLRSALLEAMTASPGRRPLLVEALESGALRLSEIEPARREEIRSWLGPDLRARFDRVARESAGSAPSRAEVIARYLKEAPARGDREHGARVFAESCAACHRLEGQGHAVGPDLAGIGRKGREALIAELLDPNLSVVPGYEAYVVVTDTGQAITGILASETASAVTFRRAGGIEEGIPRSAIREISAGENSLMPEGLEEKMTPADMADLLEYLGAGGREG